MRKIDLQIFATKLSGIDDETWKKMNATYTPSAAVNLALQQKTNAEKAVNNWALSKDTVNVRNQIMNRPKFSYDFTNDPLYNQYRDSYTRQGKLAMTDTMAQASQLTGGYGNSYATGAAQQTYNQYMQQLNDKIPELYSLARDMYDRDGSDLYNKYGMLYGEDTDRYNRLVSDRDYYASGYDSEYNRDYTRYGDDKSTAWNVGQMQNAQYNSDMDRALSYYKASGSGSGSGDTTYGANGTDTIWTFSRIDKDGKYVFVNSDGKEKTLDKGVNPYGATANPDAKNGTFKNGYQPDNYQGHPLSATGETVSSYTDPSTGTVINLGREQKVWKFYDGRSGGYKTDKNGKVISAGGLSTGVTYAVWDGTKNKYIIVGQGYEKI